MTVEDRLRDALHEADRIDPSVDLFERVNLSLEDSQTRRRRLVTAVAWGVVGVTLVATYLIWVIGSSPGTVEGWKIVLPQLVISAVLIIALAPHIRRFGIGFIDDVFHLTPETGRRFLAVLDIAYYLTFTGLLLVDADAWQLTSDVPIPTLLESSVERVAFLLLAMGVLHAVNIASLPVLGLVYNSVARASLRNSTSAPPELLSAKTADRNARAFAIALVVTLAAMLIGLLIGPLSGGLGLLQGS